jgi:hypothetical protein
MHYGIENEKEQRGAVAPLFRIGPAAWNVRLF